jgi:PAS domain S-box-containing protein
VAVKCTVDILQRELNSQASDIVELTAGLVESRKSLQRSFTALQVSDRRWLGLYENTAVGIALADRDGRILSANPALQRMLGYGRDEIVGVSLIEITEPSERDITARKVHSLFDGELPSYSVQKRYEKKDGAYLWANVCASRIPAMAEDGAMLAVIVEDITRRMEAERSLAATRAELTRVARFTAMGELVASIAHEINQPLTAVITNSQAALRWLSHATPKLDEVAAALGRVNRDASLAGQVISRIRGFLRAGEIRREPVDLARMLDELLQMLQTVLSEAGVQVSVRLPDVQPRIIADPVQLQQVILNLIINGVDAMREQPCGARQLHIEVTPEAAGGLCLAVRDSGPGVAADMEARLFEAFFSTKSDGLGMGLAISRSIIENHGGRLWLDRSEGPGACFKFTLPDQ